jgi:hypothetical protein
MIRAYRMGASFAQRSSKVDHRVRQGSTQCQKSSGIFGGIRGTVCARPREGIIPSMRGYDVVNTPFVPDQLCGDCRATCVALRQPTGERCAEQRQAILRQTKDQDDLQVRQSVHADIKIHLEDGGHVRATQISIDKSPEAGISTIAVRSVRTVIEQRRAREYLPSQFGVLDRYVRSRFSGFRSRIMSHHTRSTEGPHCQKVFKHKRLRKSSDKILFHRN